MVLMPVRVLTVWWSWLLEVPLLLIIIDDGGGGGGGGVQFGA